MPKAAARPYSGEANASGTVEDPSDWLEHYENVCQIHEWLLDQEKMDNMSLYLTGEAETWYRVNKAWIRAGDEDWETLKETFLKRFRPVNFEDDWEERVQNPVQKVGESVRAYAECYNSL